MRLTIREIAKLKSNDDTKSHILKTHDGTSLGKLKSSFDKFQKEYGSLTTHEEMSIYDEYGNEIAHIKSDGMQVNAKEVLDKLVKEGYKNIHVIHNHPRGFSGSLSTYLNKTDMLNIGKRDDDYGYLIRSISACSPNGSRMTFIHNDNFNPLNYKKLKNGLLEDMESEFLSQHQTYRDLYREKIKNSDDSPKNINDNIIKSIGDLDRVMSTFGIDEMLDDCNCKVRWKKAEKFIDNSSEWKY